MSAAGRSRATVADRVRISHEQTRVTVRFGLAFIVAAAVTAGWGSTRWLPLHLLLAGGVALAISAVSLMLTVTWSTAPAPPNWAAWAQRSCVAIGAAGIGVGRAAHASDLVVGIAGAVYAIGLLGLAALLASTVRAGVKRRFDVAVAAYVAAISAGVAGVGIGVYMAVTTPSPSLRAAHVVLNLLGLLGLVIGGTLPFFASTVGRSRMSAAATPARLMTALVWQALMVAATAALLAADLPRAAAVGLGGYALGIVVVLVLMPRPARRQLEWAGPRLVALWAGALWWIVAVTATGVDLVAGRWAFEGRWLAVIAVAAYAQILWGSLAYLLPMLRGGGHERLGAGFAATRSWVGLVAVNTAGVALVGSWNRAAAVAIAIWVVDGAVRSGRVGTARADRPSTDQPADRSTNSGVT